MATTITPSTVRETVLWQRLNSGFAAPEAELAQTLATHVADLCQEASTRMRGFPSLHSQYTLHDEVHLLRVTALMALIMPSDVLQGLNPVELTLLILAAHFHDQGMVPEAEELKWLNNGAIADQRFSLFRDTWVINHPNLETVQRQLNDSSFGEVEQQRYRRAEADLLSALLSDFLRETHGERSATLLRSNHESDPRLMVQGVSLVESLARLCQSHTGPVSALTEVDGFRVDERIGVYSVNMVYLALVLRLADVLDFDRERTPDSLYRTIDFRSPISLEEWAKHRAVTGWDIGPDVVQFAAEFEHPEYERATRRFMDYIDTELQNSAQRVREFPARAQRYRFDLPLKTERSQIGPKNGAYKYHDLEFSLSRDEIVKLLMTDKLYGSSSLCVRELLQNSLDALRHRSALFQRSELDWKEGKIELRHELDDDGHEVVSCVDNGVGMTRDIVLNFLTNAGRSYYRSPQFEQERIGLRASGVDFDPCAQFGIGFMSCFMLGDHIVIKTRRDNGPTQGYGEPLEIEISGVGGIVVLRDGQESQPVGTTVTITGRKKPRFLDVWEDKVKLVALLTQYALATEFPIEAHCTVEGVEGSILIPSTPDKPPTFMEDAGLKSIATFEQAFKEVNSNLGGCLRASFLVDANGQFTLENDEAHWELANDPIRSSEKNPMLKGNDNKPLKEDASAVFSSLDQHYDSPIALDGILVVGEPGRTDLGARPRYGEGARWFGMTAHNMYVGRSRFLLDVRGSIKPPITPARQPDFANRGLDKGPRWKFINKLIFQAQGRLWEQVATRMDARAHPELFWQLGIIYNGYNTDFMWMRSQALWEWLSVPILEGDAREWKRVTDLGPLRIEKFELGDASQSNTSFTLHPLSGGRVGTYHALTNWSPHGRKGPDDPHEPDPRHIEWDLRWTIAAISTLNLREGQLTLEVQAPDEPQESPYERMFRLWGMGDNLLTISYAGEIYTFYSVHSSCPSVNKNHALVKVAREAQYKEQPSDLEEFATRLVWCLSSANIAPILQESPSQMRRWYREIGVRFTDIDWQKINSELCPPYKVRLEDGTVVNVTAETFDKWASAAPDPEERQW